MLLVASDARIIISYFKSDKSIVAKAESARGDGGHSDSYHQHRHLDRGWEIGNSTESPSCDQDKKLWQRFILAAGDSVSVLGEGRL